MLRQVATCLLRTGVPSPAAKLGLLTLAIAGVLVVSAVYLLADGKNDRATQLEGTWLRIGAAPNCNAWAPNALSQPSSMAAIDSTEALVAWLKSKGARGVLMERSEQPASDTPEPAWLRQMRSVERVQGMVGARFSSRCAAYQLETPRAVLSSKELEVLVQVMRGIFKGHEPPQPSSFPEAMQKKEEVELLVILRLDGELRMWRSTRRSSMASAALTLGVAIRDRWQSRRAFMQEDLADAVDRLVIELWRVEDAGTLVVENLVEVQDLVPPRYGIGVEHHSGWSYRLPEVLVKDPSAVTGDMLKTDEVDARELGVGTPRLYRLRLVELDAQ